jgi:hypothetical protein
MKKLAIAIGFLAAGVTPALAAECPVLHQQVTTEAQRRLDNGAWNAKQLAAQGAKLHEEGKHADSVVKYEEAAKAVGITLIRKK